MNLKSKKVLALALSGLLSLSFFLTACGSDEEADENLTAAPGDVVETDAYYNMSDAELAALQKKADRMNKDADNFYGTWEADSEEAYNLYGSLSVDINRDGSFVARISDETFTGTWKKIDKGISFTTDIISGTFFYGETCQMTIDNSEWDYDDEDEGAAVTLTKKK